MKKQVTCMLSLVMILGLISCDNWMVESLLKKKPTAVSGIRVEPKSLSGGIGAPYEIKAIVEPENATDKGIIWTSNNDRVATVSNGLVVFQSIGTAIITAMTREGNFTDYCTVEVKRTISMRNSLMGEVGGNLSLSVSLTPGNEGITDFNLESNKADVVRVNPDKTLSLLRVGEATIKVTVTDSTIDPAYCLVKVTEAGNLAIRFGATDTGKTGAALVTETFERIHYYLLDHPWDLGEENLPKIALGDFIELPFLAVDEYPTGTGSGAVELSAPLNRPSVLRLMVVGINSFNPRANNTPDYEGGVDTPISHIVMQFKDSPIGHRMNATNTNLGGYKESELRKYLVKVSKTNPAELAKEGNFSKGLKAAGVPLDTDIIFAPTRYVANGGLGANACDALDDKIWIPTAWELFGPGPYSRSSYEVATNQARLEYYKDNASRIKGNLTNGTRTYWEASPSPDDTSKFWRVGQSGGGNTGIGSLIEATNGGDVAPAFCVK